MLTKKEKFEKAVALSTKIILDALAECGGIDTAGPNFIDTPARVGRAYLEIFDGIFDSDIKIKAILSAKFPSDSNEMVIVGPISVWSVCPHHLLPVKLRIWVSYIPDGEVLGLSKLARLAELIAKKPALQEDTTDAIVSALWENLSPGGAACTIEGEHLCMSMRGVKQEAITKTTALVGKFLSYPEVRAEFLAAVRGR